MTASVRKVDSVLEREINQLQILESWTSTTNVVKFRKGDDVALCGLALRGLSSSFVGSIVLESVGFGDGRRWRGDGGDPGLGRGDRPQVSGLVRGENGPARPWRGTQAQHSECGADTHSKERPRPDAVPSASPEAVLTPLEVKFLPDRKHGDLR